MCKAKRAPDHPARLEGRKSPGGDPAVSGEEKKSPRGSATPAGEEKKSPGSLATPAGEEKTLRGGSWGASAQEKRSSGRSSAASAPVSTSGHHPAGGFGGSPPFGVPAAASTFFLGRPDLPAAYSDGNQSSRFGSRRRSVLPTSWTSK